MAIRVSSIEDPISVPTRSGQPTAVGRNRGVPLSSMLSNTKPYYSPRTWGCTVNAMEGRPPDELFPMPVPLTSARPLTARGVVFHDREAHPTRPAQWCWRGGRVRPIETERDQGPATSWVLHSAGRREGWCRCEHRPEDSRRERVIGPYPMWTAVKSGRAMRRVRADRPPRARALRRLQQALVAPAPAQTHPVDCACLPRKAGRATGGTYRDGVLVALPSLRIMTQARSGAARI